MIRVALVRGKYLNNFEGQNYLFKNNIDLTAIASIKPIHYNFPFKLINLPSLADLPLGRVGKFVANRTLGDTQILFGLERFKSKFQIFHTADPHYFYSYQLAKLRSKKMIRTLVSTSWETIPFNNEGTVRKKYVKNFTKKYTDLFICYSRKAKNCLIKEGVSENKIKIVKLGVNLNKFNVKSGKLKVKRKVITLLFVGRWVEEKGIKDLHEAYKKVKSYNLKLKIVEKKDYEEMPEIYRSADIFIMPSKTTKTWEEQYGMVLIEAMASGLPIVAYNSGVIAENLGDAGILIKEGDVNGLCNAILRLSNDKDLRLKLGTMGRRRAEKYFDSRKTAQKIARIYENISNNID